MLSVYLSDSPLIPAGGLYHYQPTATGFDESLVQKDGQPGPPIRRSLALQLPAAPVSLQPNYYVHVSDWLEIVDDQVTSYLAFMPVDEQPHTIWSNGLKRLGDHTFFLVPQVRQTLPKVSRNRRQDGYERVFNEAPKRNDLQPLVENAQNFWQALFNVSLGLIRHLEFSLDAREPNHSLSGLEPFHNPIAVFQLNRMVAEGFIEGYAQANFHLTNSANYDVADGCKETWKTVLGQAQLDAIVRIDELPEDQQHLIGLLKLNPLGLPADLIVADLTPGVKPSQELAFWYLHFPHWRIDLDNAVRTLREQGIVIEDHDWQLIAHLIIRNFPAIGKSLSLGDRLLAWVVRETDELIGNLTNLDASLIFAILKDIERQAST